VAHPFVALGQRLQMAHEAGGDVHARFAVRVAEVRVSLALIEELAEQASALRIVTPRVSGQGGSGIGITEGWRGSIVHRVEADRLGVITRLKIVDPSFLHLPALSVALADT